MTWLVKIIGKYQWHWVNDKMMQLDDKTVGYPNFYTKIWHIIKIWSHFEFWARRGSELNWTELNWTIEMLFTTHVSIGILN